MPDPLAPPAGLRDRVALAVLTHLLGRHLRPTTLSPPLRQQLIRDAFVWADDFLLQRAFDCNEGLTATVGAHDPCLPGYKHHRWVGTTCVRCPAVHPHPRKRGYDAENATRRQALRLASR